jgi:hypothetical protein
LIRVEQTVVIRHVEIGGDMRAFAEILSELGVELAYVEKVS